MWPPLAINPIAKVFNKFKQTPYEMSGNTEKGIDCSGLTCQILSALGVNVNEQIPDQTSEGIWKNAPLRYKVDDIPSFDPSMLKPGSIIGFDTGEHAHDVGRTYGIDHIGVVNKDDKGVSYLVETNSVTGPRQKNLKDLVDSYYKRGKLKNLYVGSYDNEIKHTHTGEFNEYFKKQANKEMAGGGFLDKLPGLVNAGSGAAGALNPAIPAVGMVVANLIDMMNTESYIPAMQKNSNPYGMAMGGMLENKDFTQYNTGPHGSGMDQGVNSTGKPVGENPVALVQNKENTYKGYVYSDKLENPDTGNTFNVDMQKLVKKHKKSDLDPLSENTLDFKANRLAKKNDAVRQEKEMMNYKQIVEKACGGKLKGYGGKIGTPLVNKNGGRLPEYADGGPFDNIGPMANYNMLTNLYNIPAYPTVSAETGLTPQVPPATSSQNPISNPGTPPMVAGIQAAAPIAFNQTINNAKKRIGGNRVVNPIPTNTGIGQIEAPPLVNPTQSTTGQTSTNLTDKSRVYDNIGMIHQIIGAMQPAERRDPVLADYSTADNRFNRSNVNYQEAINQALGQSNAALSTIRDGSRSNAVRMSNVQGALANTQNVVSNIAMQERNANAQMDMRRGMYEANKAQDNATRINQTEIENLAHKATAQMRRDATAQSLINYGKQIRMEDIAKMSNTEMALMMGLKYPDFAANKEQIDAILRKVRSGEYTIGQAQTEIYRLNRG